MDCIRVFGRLRLALQQMGAREGLALLALIDPYSFGKAVDPTSTNVTVGLGFVHTKYGV